MLTEIRDRSSGWFAWIVAAFIIVPMAFFGVQEYATSESAKTLLEVGDQKITEPQYQAQLNTVQQQQRRSSNGQANEAYLNSDAFKQNVLQQMVNRALIDDVAEKQNYQISNAQLVDYIKQSPIFQVDGKFNNEAYERYVAGSQYSKSQFEEVIRNDTIVSQVMSGYHESALVLSDELTALLAAQAEQRTFDLVTVEYQDFVESIKVSDSEIEEYFSENQDNFLEPEKVSLNYVELDVNAISDDIVVTEEQLRDVYEQNSASYISTETRETRHILLSTNGDNDDEQKAKANELVAQLRDGSDFAELAKANSDDPGSGANGGDLGLVERGMMVEEFEQTTFDLDENIISDPIKSQFGYHIIEVTKINTPEQQSFDDVRTDIEAVERRRMAEDQLLEKVELLRDLAYEQPDDIQLVAEEIGLSLQKTELFDRNTGTGIATNAVVRTTAFDDLVFIENVISEPIEISAGKHVVIKKLDYKESQPKELATVSEQIKQILINQKASRAASDQGTDLLALAKSNWTDLVASVEEKERLEVTTHTVALTDQTPVVDTAVLAKVTNATLAEGEPEIINVESADGNYHIMRLTEIKAGDVSAVSEQIKDSTRRMIEQRNGQSLANAYLDSLRTELAPEIDAGLL